MNKKQLTIFLILILVLRASSAFSQGKEFERVRTISVPAGGGPIVGEELEVEYFMSPGDIIEVYVWQNADLTKEVTIGPDGNISYPLIGTIKAAGLTTTDLQDKIKEGLSQYIRYPAECRIEAGDTIEVFVWKNPELTRSVRVRGDGKITYPLIGTLHVAGLTIDELQNKIKEELSKHVIKSPSEYRVKPGDRIEVFIWRQADLTREVLVRKDGKLSYPLIGTIDAEGLTLEELQAKVKEEFSKYIRFPDVTVTVRETAEEVIFDVRDVIVSISSLSENKITLLGDVIVSVKEFAGDKIIILGEIEYPGIYTYTGRMNLIEAIALAGDFSEEAKRESIIVVSGNFTPHPDVRRVNLFRAIRKGTSGENIMLRPNDLVYVPTKFISDFNRFLDDFGPIVDRAFEVFGWRNALREWYHHGESN